MRPCRHDLCCWRGHVGYTMTSCWTTCPLSGAVAQSLWLYLGTGAGLVAVAYAPPVPGLAWAVQFAWGLLLLAAVWTAQGLWLSGLARTEAGARSAALLNSAVLYLGVCLV